MVSFTYQDFCKYKASVFSTYNSVYENDNSSYTYSSSYDDKVTYSINDIHDKLYRDFLNDNVEFSLFLKHFLNIDIHSNNLINCNSDFVTEDLKNRHSDIVYKLKNEPIYFFLEHQSSIDYSISYRIFEYYYLILKSTVDLKQLKNKDYKFPSIVPILLYTGNKKWNFIPNLKEKLYPNTHYKNHILDFRYEYINIFNYSTQELLDMNSMISYLLSADKCRTRKELLSILEKLSNIVTDNYKKTKIRRLIVYVYKDFIQDDIRDELLKKFEEGDDVNMKYAWDYVREDIARTRAKDKKSGLLEGVHKATYEMISRMLENGESIDKIILYSGYNESKIEKIKKRLNLKGSVR